MAFVSFAISVFLFCSSAHASTNPPHLGVWISIFSPEKVLYSKENADRMIKTCKELGIDQVYLQIYRGDKAYYNSSITDRSAYDEMVSAAGGDPLKYIIAQAGKNGIKIYAWINLLSLAQNENAPVLKYLGGGILTRDRHGRTPFGGKNKDELDKYFSRENQLFMEPGDPRVRKYLVSIVDEVVRKYPGFNGVHLDYIRYPAAVPFTPGSRFDSYGISYGYGDINTGNFKTATGLDVRKMEHSRDNFRKWDDWRRSRVTTLLRDISKTVRALSPSMEISCTTVPSIERAYTVTFQNWPAWLKEKIVDYVVVMNYTDDAEFMALTAGAVLYPDLKDRIYIGIGAYLLKDAPKTFETELDTARGLSPAGIVIYSYDEIASNDAFRKYLR